MSRCYLTLGAWLYPEVKPFIGLGKRMRIFQTPHNGAFNIKMSSTRLECFHRSPKCAMCGLVGEIFLLQSHLHDKDSLRHPHFNLYACSRRDKLIMMTQDHQIPKAHGDWKDDRSFAQMTNLETQCFDCNHKKGSSLPKWLGGGLI